MTTATRGTEDAVAMRVIARQSDMGGFTILMQCAFSRAQGCARLKQANDERIILADRPRGSAPEDESGCHRDIIGSSANAADCPPLWLGLSIDESAFEHRYARVSTLETAPARAQDAATNAPFFIVGSGRSGSTMLRMMLTAH